MKNAFLGARFFLVATRTAKGGIKLVFIKRLPETDGLHNMGMDV